MHIAKVAVFDVQLKLICCTSISGFSSLGDARGTHGLVRKHAP